VTEKSRLICFYDKHPDLKTAVEAVLIAQKNLSHEKEFLDRKMKALKEKARGIQKELMGKVIEELDKANVLPEGEKAKDVGFEIDGDLGAITRIDNSPFNLQSFFIPLGG